MPTLRQVNIHPSTQERLSSGIKRKRSDVPSLSCVNNGIDEPLKTGDNHSHETIPTTITAETTALFVPVRTPSALLSRDAAQLSSHIHISLRNIQTLRRGVARAIISNPYSGYANHAAEVVAGVTKFCCVEEEEDHDDDDVDDCYHDSRTRRFCIRPKQPWLMGAIPALDMCARACFMKNMSWSSRQNNNDMDRVRSKYQSCIRTGSNAIDKLLAPDQSYSSYNEGWNLPYPFKLSLDTEHNDENVHCTNRNNFSSNSEPSRSGYEQGVPFGMITEFSGPPSSGKTQLALSITAHAVVENGFQVHYISGGGSRRAIARRLYTMFVELIRSSFEEENCALGMTEDVVKSSALKRLESVHMSSVPDAYSSLATLARIDNEECAYRNSRLNDDANRNHIYNGTLLIIDSVSNCLGHHLASDVGAALASQVASTLRYMARTHDGHCFHLDGGNGTTNEAQNLFNADASKFRFRRFAVIVINGSVVKRSFDNNSHRFFSETPSYGKMRTLKQPAMGQYWHVSDIGIWLDVDESSVENVSSQSIKFYDDAPSVALALSEKKLVQATLLNHYGKSCYRINDGQYEKPSSKFFIRSIGITDK